MTNPFDIVSAITDASGATDAIKSIFGNPGEPLHPDLQRCLTSHNTIHHPLYISVFHVPELNGMANMQYKAKRKVFDEDIEDGNYGVIATLVEKPYRLQYLFDYIGRIPEDQWWKLLRDVWLHAENHWQHKRILPALFKGRTNTIPEMMDEEDRKEFDALPDTITVYRGVNRTDATLGWSWSLDRRKAEWFAARFLSPKRNGVIYQTTVSKKAILFYTNARKKREVVINPKSFRSWRKTFNRTIVSYSALRELQNT